MPRLCANLSMMFNEVPFLERFEAAAKSGFAAVEFLFPYDHQAAEIRRRLDDNGLKQVLFNGPPGDWSAGERGIACLPGRVQEFRDGVRRALEYAVTLDCRLLHVMAGLVPAAMSQATVGAIYATNLEWAAREAAAAGVMLTIEPLNPRDVPGYYLRTQEQGAAIVEAIGRERVGLQFDIYHCQIAEGDLTRRMEELLPAIAHMQLADVPKRNEPGTGEIGWEYVFRRIDELGYRGWIGCEYRPAGNTLEGLAWRKRYGV